MINDDVLDVDYHPPVILNRIENSNPFRSKRPAIEGTKKMQVQQFYTLIQIIKTYWLPVRSTKKFG